MVLAGNGLTPGGDQARDIGVCTEFTEMYKSFYEFRIPIMIFGKKVGDEFDPEFERDSDLDYEEVFENGIVDDLLDDLLIKEIDLVSEYFNDD